MRVYLKIVGVIAHACRTLVEVAIIVIMLLTVADVLLRHIAHTTIMGVTEYSQMLMAIILLATCRTSPRLNVSRKALSGNMGTLTI